jgi:glycosyltransferase involved in cell wall biosynthesis
MTKLSIITINYNNLSGLKQTIKSVINQTLKEFEYIIIDGGSTDGSESYIYEMQQHFTYWVSEADNGIYNAMNKGIAKANGQYLLFLNSGDYLENPNVIEDVFSELTGEDSFISCNLVMDNGINTYVKEHPEEISFGYIYHHTLKHPATFIHSRIFKKYGLYNENNKIVSDWELFFEALCLNGESYRKSEIVLTHFDMVGISSKQYYQAVSERETIINKHLHHLVKTDYGKYLMDNTLIENKRLVYLKEIEKSKILRRTLSLIMLLLYKLAKLFKR